MLHLPRRMLEESFAIFRACGAYCRECQVYWVSEWSNPRMLTTVVHPKHKSSMYGLAIDDRWIGDFWNELAEKGHGVRVQIHTHPYEAFHSQTDDEFRLLFDVGFLSLVIPDFAKGQVGFDDAFLTEIQPDGRWQQVPIRSRILVDDAA